MKNRRTFKTVITENKAVMIGCLLLAAAGATAYQYFLPAKYVSTAVIRTAQPAAATEINTATFLTKAFTNNESTTSAMCSADLHTLPATAPFQISYRLLGGTFQQQDLTIVPQGSGNYRVTAELYGIEKTILAKDSAAFKLGNIEVTITPAVKHTTIPRVYFTGPEYLITLNSSEYLAGKIIETGSLAMQSGEGTLSLKLTDKDPARAQQLLKQIVTTYTGTAASENTSVEANSSESKTESLAAELALAEQEIAEYKAHNNITEIETDIKAESEYGNALRSQKSELEMQMVALGNLHTYIRKNMGGDNSGVDYDVITDPMFAEALNKINDKYIKRAAAGIDPMASDAETMALKESVSERILNTRRKIAVKLDQLNGMIAAHRLRIKSFPAIAGELESMNRQLQLKRKVYDLLIEKQAAAIVSGTVPETTNAIIENATYSAQPVAPDPLKTYPGFLTAGLLLGLIWSSLKSQTRNEVIHDRTEAEKAAKGVKYIGGVGTLRGETVAAEPAFSNLATRFLLHDNAKMVTVTSSLKGEGKSFIATNFAKALAALDKKVLLIDMNSYRPELEHLFDIQCDRTLADALAKKCDIHDSIFITNIPNLEITVAGSLSGGVNGLLISKETAPVFEKLKNHYDAIIVDTPEVGKYIDAVPMMKISDLNFYVVRANGTSKTQLANAEFIRKDFGINNLYLVLNTIGKGVNHSGISTKGKYRKLHTVNNPKISTGYIPAVLRKIALWFY
ncbi:MAG TPA: AAA family ATPase [Bacteroidia bacterium]|nr:AAA family ATPase [Bacteroidia bacterium]